MFATNGGTKRAREDDGDLGDQHGQFEKRARPTTGPTEDGDKWFHVHHDSVLSTPATSSQAREQQKYDSDDEQSSSSLVSEPGSPQDVSMSSGDEADVAYPQSPEDDFDMKPQAAIRSHWGQRLQTNRIPTPIVGSGAGIRTHVRQRHPQEIYSSDHLELPSPIDEDEVPTPPSAAEAAGSQMSLLSVRDIDMDEPDSVPTISINPARIPNSHNNNRMGSVLDVEPMDSGSAHIVIRKQRQRSGALSSGNSPVRAGPSTIPAKRGISMGFRADCEKCRNRVPGHMNHFIS